MTKQEIINLVSQVDVCDEKASFISTFGDKKEKEIVAVISAWLSNGVRNEDYVLKSIICGEMKGQPIDFLQDYRVTGCYKDREYESLCGLLTYHHFHHLLIRLYSISKGSDTLQEAYLYTLTKKKPPFSHDAFVRLLGKNTGFQTTKTNGTFYRFNLLFYWLTYRLNVWQDVDTTNAILPCNDKVFDNAYRLGIVEKPIKANLKNAVMLTNKAREWLGNNDFYKLYEILNNYGGY